MSHGYSAVASISAARGATRSRTIWRIVSRKSNCSWVSEYVSTAVVGIAVQVSGGPFRGYESRGNRHLALPDRRRGDPVFRRGRGRLGARDLDRRDHPDGG